MLKTKYLLPLILILCLTFALSGFSADLYSTYDQRIKLTVSNTNIDAELTWFPVTVFLTSTQGEEVFAEFDADADFDKVAFTTSDGSTQVYADCELFDDSESKAIYHIAKTGVAISNTGTTDFYMYYDNDASSNSTYIGASGGTAAQSVWDGNFKAVYHMADGASTSAIYDSTSNNNDGTKKDANEPIEAAGKVGQGQDSDGTNDYITIPDLGEIADFTVEMLLNADTLPGDDTWDGVTGNQGWAAKNMHIAITPANWSGVDNSFRVATNKTAIESTTAMPTSTWHLWAVKYDQTTTEEFYLYKDGVVEDATTANGANQNIDFNNWRIANIYDATRLFDGKTDEFRLSNSVRSAAWLKATYNSLWDTLLTYGAEETGATFPLTKWNGVVITKWNNIAITKWNTIE